MRRRAICLTAIVITGSASAAGDRVEAPLEPVPWPEWVHHHWVWENEGTRESATALVRDYLDRDVPVGALIIDSPWETGYNSFEFDEGLYPNPREMVDELHGLDVRVLLWITSMINVDSPNYQFAFDRGYYLNDGATVEWWKGEGSFIDYTNPEALDYWHGLMDGVLDLGIDGWKTDGTEFYTILLGVPRGHGGVLRPRMYADLYYRDFFYYTREALGRDRIIMSRPVDSVDGVFHWSFSPHDVLMAGWVGDQDPTFKGLRVALGNLFHSAWRNYVNIGSDIGGFRSGDGEPGRTKELLIRWAQMGALMPLMENGGSGEHRPWIFDQETLDIYRDYVLLHHSLVPYLMTEGARAWEKGDGVVEPLAGTWNYRLGKDLFVAPIVMKSSKRWIRFPLFGHWIDWWTGERHKGGALIRREVPLEEIPLYQREGSIIPLHAVSRVPGLGTIPAPRDAHVFLVARPGESGVARIREFEGPGRIARYEATESGWVFTVSPHDQPAVWALRGLERDALVIRDANDERRSRIAWRRQGETLWIDAPPGRDVRVCGAITRR